MAEVNVGNVLQKQDQFVEGSDKGVFSPHFSSIYIMEPSFRKP